VAAASGLTSTRIKSAAALLGVLAATTALAQQGASPENPGPVNSSRSLRLPQNPTVYGTAMPAVVKATAIVNGDIITQSDIDHRVALLAMAQQGGIPPEELDRVRQQVLRNLIDETLQIQAAKAEKIDIRKSDIDRTVQRVATNVKRTTAQLEEYLAANG